MSETEIKQAKIDLLQGRRAELLGELAKALEHVEGLKVMLNMNKRALEEAVK